MYHANARGLSRVALSLGALLWALNAPAAAGASAGGSAGEKSESQKAAAPTDGATSTKKGAHPPTAAFDRAVDPTVIPTAPPAARNEERTPSPGEKYIWVPGHYVPVQRKWIWTPGKWSLPPDPGAVWIPGTYDSKTQRWSPGYWQPGEPYPTTVSTETSAAK